jgi:hypothetical protein
MFTLIRKIFWCALFLVFTLGFVTLFDHGFVTTTQFSTDARGEVNDLVALVRPIQREKDNSDKVVP